MISSIKECALLNNGLEMPWLGFGVLNIEDGDVDKDLIIVTL